MTETSCKEIAASFSNLFVTRQELRAAEEAIDYCDAESLEVMRLRLVDYQENPQDYDYEDGALEHFELDLKREHPLASRLESRIEQLRAMTASAVKPDSFPANPILSDFRLFFGGGLSRASTPNEPPEMPTDSWFQAG